MGVDVSAVSGFGITLSDEQVEMITEKFNVEGSKFNKEYEMEGFHYALDIILTDCNCEQSGSAYSGDYNYHIFVDGRTPFEQVKLVDTMLVSLDLIGVPTKKEDLSMISEELWW